MIARAAVVLADACRRGPLQRARVVGRGGRTARAAVLVAACARRMARPRSRTPRGRCARAAWRGRLRQPAVCPRRRAACSAFTSATTPASGRATRFTLHRTAFPVPAGCRSETAVTHLRAGDRIVPVNQFVIQKALDRQVVFYWYHGRGRVTANEYANKAFLMLDAAHLHRTNGGLVRPDHAGRLECRCGQGRAFDFCRVALHTAGPTPAMTRSIARSRAWLAVALLVGACSHDPVARSASYVTSGDGYTAKQQFARAILEYRNAIKERPDWAEPHYKLAQCVPGIGRSDQGLWRIFADGGSRAGERRRAAEGRQPAAQRRRVRPRPDPG